MMVLPLRFSATAHFEFGAWGKGFPEISVKCSFSSLKSTKFPAFKIAAKALSDSCKRRFGFLLEVKKFEEIDW